jgi:hypothetical protein
MQSDAATVTQLALIGESIALFGVDEFVARVEQAHPPRKGKRD